MHLLIVALVLFATSAYGDTEIYRCSLDDGTVAFQEMPCAEPAEESDDSSKDEKPAESSATGVRDDFFDFSNPFDEPEGALPPAESEPTMPASRNRAECEKTTRDAIDAIDLEMRSNSYTPEEGRVYLAELRTLTQQLRTCKQM